MNVRKFLVVVSLLFCVNAQSVPYNAIGTALVCSSAVAGGLLGPLVVNDGIESKIEIHSKTKPRKVCYVLLVGPACGFGGAKLLSIILTRLCKYSSCSNKWIGGSAFAGAGLLVYLALMGE